ncbi:MAG: MFS transporter [Actinobacteria bacterium]|nr:MFS transporter [Actinomycetota bacterium]
MSPLRASRDYRLLWFGELISETGRQITLVAVFIQLTDLTGSPAAVGLVGLVQLVPLIVSTLWSGPLVDRMDRRKLLVVAQLGFATATLVLLLGSLGRPPVGLVYGAAGLTALFSGLDSPTRSAMIPNLVGKERLPAAIALNQVMWNTTMIVGPAVAGIVIARLGLTWAYTIDLATFAATLGAAALMRPAPPRGEVGATRGLASIREGFAYLRGRRVLQSTFTIDIVAMVFGMPRALFAFLAVSQFRRGPEVVGALFSAIAVGALAGALTAGWVGRVRRQGLAVMWAVAVWGAAIAGFGLSGDRLWLALLLLAVAGGADVISAVFRSTILHLSVPDTLRGRLAGIHILVVTGGPRLGDLEAGIVAGLVSPTFSVVSGGVACIAGVGAIGLLVPQLRRWRAGEET